MRVMRNYLFSIMVMTYSLETQHYFHVKTKGKKFKHILTLCSDLFDQVEQFAITTTLNFTDFNLCIGNGLNIGELDALEKCDEKINIWEFKCTSEISLKHILQVLMYNIVYNKLDCLDDHEEYEVTTNFINFLKGEIVNIKILVNKEKINNIMSLLM